MISRIREQLRQHRACDIALIVLISLAATSNWWDLELPKGHDAVADMLAARAASSSIFTYHTLAGWSTDWFMGHAQFYVHSPLSAILLLLPGLLFGWVLGTKLLFLSFFALSGVFAYLYVYELTRNRAAGIVAGLAYVFLPYHIIDVGFEGHQGSFSTPYMLIPLTLLFLEKSIKSPCLKYVLVNAVLLAFLTLTFPQVLPLLVGPFFALYVILRIWWERRRGRDYLKTSIGYSAAALCLALLLSAFWWLPLLSEIRYSYATTFSVEDARDTSATFLQAITLRPSMCCAPASAFGAAGSVFLEMLRFIPFLLALLGIILNRRNRYVWFFSLSILICVLLAMGPASHLNVFGLAYRYLPFFNHLRTPVRFLLFASLAYAVLIGLGVHALADRLGQLHLPKPRIVAVPLLLPVLASLIIVGNTWQETRTAFDTYSLTGDTEKAMSWLAEREDGDYRIADPPFDAYVEDSEAGWMIRPLFWTYLHGKETAYGPGLSLAVVWTASTLDSINADIAAGPFDVSHWLTVFNVKYVLLDKTDPLSSNVVLDSAFEKVWHSDTIDIYENHAMMPRLFAVTSTVVPTIESWGKTTVNSSIEYTKIRPGEYQAHVSLDSPAYLVLSESYHPGWVAHVNGRVVDSQPVYECLNGFPLEAGDYDVTLQFITTPLRTAANVISGLAALSLLSTISFFLIRRQHRNRRTRGMSADARQCHRNSRT